MRDWREGERRGPTVGVSPCVLEMYRVQETSEWYGTLTRSIKRDVATEIVLKTSRQSKKL